MIIRTRELADDLLKKAINQLHTSSDFKKPRLDKFREADEMLLGKVKQHFRQQFNVPLPTLSGFYETLAADLDDPVQVKIKNNPSKNLKVIHNINDMLSVERKSLKSNARWDYKDRISRKYAISTGRGILKYFSSADPYTSNIEAVDPYYFHCQPRGGGLLERHLFVGEEGISRTKAQLLDGVKQGIYDKKNVELLISRATSKEYLEEMSSFEKEKNSRFQALNLNPDGNNYVGETTFNLCEWVMTQGGERWYLLFDPWTKIWIRFEKLTDIYSSGYYPWVSYATHEDDKNFWSLSILSDILYPIADSINTLFNQELTNRQKINLNSKFYDPDMIKNVQKLDESQYRPDALVPVNTFGGSRRISEGVYRFDTPQLTGTIDLTSWLEEFTGKQTGIYQNIPDATKAKGRSQNIVFAEIQQMAKRIDYRSHSYTEAWGELALRYIQGLKDNLTEAEAINIIGVDAFGFKKELKKLKIDKDDITIISTKQQNQEDALKKQQKKASLDMLAMDPGVNPQWRREHILKDVGGWEEEEVEEAMDMRGMGRERDQFAAADDAIRSIIKGKEPEFYWNATTSFQRKILDFTTQHKLTLGDKAVKLLDYINQHNQVVQENMVQLAQRIKASQPQQPSQGQSGQGQPNQGQPKPPISKKPSNQPPQPNTSMRSMPIQNNQMI